MFGFYFPAIFYDTEEFPSNQAINSRCTLTDNSPHATSVSSDKQPSQGQPTKPPASASPATTLGAPPADEPPTANAATAAETITGKPICAAAQEMQYRLPSVKPALTNAQTIQCITLSQQFMSSDRLVMIVELARCVDPLLTHGQIRQIVGAADVPSQPISTQSRHKQRRLSKGNSRGMRRGPSKREKKAKRQRRAKKTKK